MDKRLTEMTPSRPYLLRAVYDWVVDNGFTPQVLVNAEADGVAVPGQYVKDGRIVLNVSASAVRNLVMGNETLSFSARFAGSPFQVSVPVSAVLAIVARENGAGMSFPEEDAALASARQSSGRDEAPAAESRTLKAVTSVTPEPSGEDGQSDAGKSDAGKPEERQPPGSQAAEQPEQGERADGSDADPDDPPPDPGAGPPRLRVVK